MRSHHTKYAGKWNVRLEKYNRSSFLVLLNNMKLYQLPNDVNVIKELEKYL